MRSPGPKQPLSVLGLRQTEPKKGRKEYMDSISPAGQDSHTENGHCPIETLFEHAFGDQTGILAVASARPKDEIKDPDDPTNFHQAYYRYPEQTHLVKRWLREEDEKGRDVYYCIHLLTAKRRTKDYAANVLTLWADGDGAEIPEGFPEPTFVVESSPGREQFGWRLTRPIAPERAERLNKRIAYGIGADKSGYDLTQLLRPPGTTNHKYEGLPGVELVSITDAAYDPDELAQRLPELVSDLESVAIDPHEPPIRLNRYQREVWDGKHPKYKDNGKVNKSDTLYKIGCELFEAGLRGDALARAIKERDKALGYDKYQDNREYRRIVGKIVAKNNATNGTTHNAQKALGGNVCVPDGVAEAVAAMKGRNLKGNLEARSFADIGEPEPAEWIIKNLFQCGFPGILYGMGGEGKSWLAMFLALCVASGREYWLGHKIEKHCPVLYIDFELDPATQSRRAHRLMRGMGLDAIPENLMYISALGNAAEDVFDKVYEACIKHGIGLVVLDSVGNALEGDSEASKDVLDFMRTYIAPLTAHGIATVLIDHIAKLLKGENRKDKLPFGSVYKFNSTRSILQLQGNWDDTQNRLATSFRHVKTNFGPKVPDFTAILDFDDDGTNDVAIRRVNFEEMAAIKAPTLKDRIIAVLESHGDMTRRTIADVMGEDPKTVRERVRDLISEGRVEGTGEKDGGAELVRAVPGDGITGLYLG